MTRYQKVIIGLFLLIALGIRIHAALHDNTSVLTGDAATYDQMAMNLALGKGYRYGSGEGELTAQRVPLYSLFLSGIYRAVGHSYRAVRIVQAILSTLTVLLIVLWARSLFGGLSACFAAIIASVYPAFYAYYFSSTVILSETLYVFLFTAALYTFSSYWIRPSWPLALASGLLWGLSNLTRPMSFPLLLLLPFILIPLRYPLRQVIRYCGIVWFVVVLLFTPWTIRNYLVFHTFFPLETRLGVNLYASFHPENRDGFGFDAFHKYYLPEEERLRSQGVPEAERANYFLRKGLGFIRTYPGHAFRLISRRILLYMDPHTTFYREEGKKRIVTWGYLFVLVGTVAAFFLGLRRKNYRREILSLCLIFGYFVLFHGFIASSERFRFPTEPILIILASFALGYLPLFRRHNSQAVVESKA